MTSDPLGPDTAGDDFGAFDTSTSKYVVPIAGDYRVDLSVEWAFSLPQDTAHELYLNVNDSTVA